jgi:hypothetical protein
MREFADVNLASIDFSSLNSLMAVRTKLSQHLNTLYFNEMANLDSTSLISHLQQYLALKSKNPANPSELLAQIIPYLHNDQQLIGNTDINLRLLILKLVFRQHGYPNEQICQLDYNQRLAAINKLQHKICAHENWPYEVNKIYTFLKDKHLGLAQTAMQEILDITYRASTYTSKQRADLFSLQVINCIDLIEFIHEHQLAEFNQIYNIAATTLKTSIAKLQQLPDVHANAMFFAWNILRPSQNHKIIPIVQTQYTPTMRLR